VTEHNSDNPSIKRKKKNGKYHKTLKRIDLVLEYFGNTNIDSILNPNYPKYVHK